MRVNVELLEEFGTFHNRKLYQGIIKTKTSKANLFVIEQVAIHASNQTQLEIYVDATFNVGPKYSSQLLIFIARIGSMVKMFLN